MAGLRDDVVASYSVTPQEVTFYNNEGYLPLPGFLRADAVPGLVDEVFEVLSKVQGIERSAMDRSSGAADRLRQCMQYRAGSRLDAMINSPVTLGIASALIGGKAHRYLPFTAVKAGGGGGVFDYHQDNNYTQHDPAVGSLNIWVALVDMTPENGCLRVIPKSHLHGQLPAEEMADGHRRLKVDEKDLFPLRMRAGDAVAFTRWTVHGSGPNNTDKARVGYALQYHRDDVRWLDKADNNTWKKLLETPRAKTEPVAELVRAQA